MSQAGCRCTDCVEACYGRPGWFLPGEAERVAETLGEPVRVVFHSKLVVEYDRRDPTVFALSPGVVHGPKGVVAPRSNWGPCVFLTKDRRCGIHAVKPFICRAYRHDHDIRPDVARAKQAWGEHQDALARLLGRAPAMPPLSIGDQMSLGIARHQKATGREDASTDRVLMSLTGEIR